MPDVTCQIFSSGGVLRSRWTARPPPLVSCHANSAGRQHVNADIAIIGGGVIGLATAYSLLQESKRLSVVLVEANHSIPATAVGSGAATGAGQGYIWLAHRDPHSAAWPMAVHSKRLWEQLLCGPSGSMGGQAAVEWQAAGSILLATDEAEAAQLAQRQQLLADAGLHAELWDAARLHTEEPALSPAVSAGLLLRSDAQLNGRMAAAALLEACERTSGFSALLGQAVQGFELCPDSGRVTAVLTGSHRILVHKAAVVAAGAWSGALLAAAGVVRSSSEAWLSGLQPRKGHLLELPASALPSSIQRGLMEIGYAKHYSKAGAADARQLDVTFTATTSASGTLLLGSSREFCGFDGQPDAAVMHAILERAEAFLPGVSGVSMADVSVRVGLRPYAARGLPYVGPVPGVPELFVAAGHEGSGLSLAPATGQLLSALILEHDAAELAFANDLAI